MRPRGAPVAIVAAPGVLRPSRGCAAAVRALSVDRSHRRLAPDAVDLALEAVARLDRSFRAVASPVRQTDHAQGRVGSSPRGVAVGLDDHADIAALERLA